MQFQACLGIVLIVAIAWLASESRRTFDWRLVGAALALQIGLALLLIHVPFVRDTLLLLNGALTALESASIAGASFVFGFLGGGASAPFEVTSPPDMYVLAFRLLPQILIFSVLVAVLWHWRVLPLMVRGFTWCLRRTLGIGGAEGLAASASVFLGMVEAPLVIRAYLGNMTRSELFVVMTCGMGTVAGSVLILFATFLDGLVENPLGQLLIASVISIPAAVMIARLMVPPGEQMTDADLADGLRYESSMDAVTRGTTDGLRLVANIGAMLIVLVALVALVNALLSSAGDIGDAPITLQRILGWAFAPAAWLIGIPWNQAHAAGALLGTKLVLNELFAYAQFAALPEDTFSERARVIITFALCGFANFGSLAILVAGFSTLAPERRNEVLQLGPKSLISGTLVTLMTGAIVGLVY